MMYSILAFLVLAPGLGSQSQLVCVRGPIIQQRIQETVKTHERGCKLKTKRENQQGHYAYYDWECQGVTVSALISTHPSIERASEVFKALPDTFEENGLKMKVTLKNVGAGLGDENYTWVDDLNSGISGVDFRRKCVVVHVGSSSAKRAYQFARHIADAVANVD